MFGNSYAHFYKDEKEKNLSNHCIARNVDNLGKAANSQFKSENFHLEATPYTFR